MNLGDALAIFLAALVVGFVASLFREPKWAKGQDEDGST